MNQTPLNYRHFGLRLAGLVLATSIALCGPASGKDEVCDLSQANDPYLQQQLDALIVKQRLAEAVKRDDLALSLLVLTDPNRPRLAQVNGDYMMYAASLPKIVILLGAAEGIDEGRLTLNEEVEEDLNLMIRKSCNSCATRMINWVGKEHLTDLVQDPRYGLYDLQNGGLWLGKPYSSGTAWKRDPLKNLSHAATTFQTARYFCGLERGTLVSPEQTELMLSALSDPAIHHKFVRGLRPYKDLDIYRKSGTWRTFHADSVLVHSGEDVYIIAGLADSPTGSTWLQDLASPLHEIATAKQPTP